MAQRALVMKAIEAASAFTLRQLLTILCTTRFLSIGVLFLSFPSDGEHYVVQVHVEVFAIHCIFFCMHVFVLPSRPFLFLYRIPGNYIYEQQSGCLMPLVAILVHPFMSPTSSYKPMNKSGSPTRASHDGVKSNHFLSSAQSLCGDNATLSRMFAAISQSSSQPAAKTWKCSLFTRN